MGRELITSAQNPKIKRLLALQKDSSLRRECSLFVLEGRRELEHCMDAGYEPDSVFICHELLSRAGVDPREWPGAKTAGRGFRIFEVSEEVYEKAAYRGGTEGVIAEIKSRSTSLGGLKLPDNPLIVVLEAVEKPGNIGAVLRSADAAGADAVLICDPLTDLYNPNLIRASIGAVFTLPCVACTSAEALEWLRSRGIRILTAQLQDSALYYDTDMRGPTAIVMGTESTGLSRQWRDAASARIRIPMLGSLDSLNVSVSAAILLFEAVRQRA